MHAGLQGPHQTHGQPGSADHSHADLHHAPHEARSQPVVLDLGGEVGALIVRTSPELAGVEVEISPTGDDAARTHKQVLERQLGVLTVHALVYDGLREGDYTLWVDGVAVERRVHVPGGAVAELDWRGPTPSHPGSEPIPARRRNMGVST